ncbi:hypothetical protein RMATCC62417_03135 [Rhizopus microsporus]|nr:hypothetical protein RMATCC62417_03135 [Rhizopus microsporus]
MYTFISSLQEKNYLVRFTVNSQYLDATYKTNVHKLTFVNIVGTSNVTSTNSGRESLQTFLIACAWVSNELEATYTWVFEQLRKSIWPNHQNDYPEVFVTGNHKAIRNAIKGMFPSSGSLLCYIHLKRNFITDIGPSFTPEFPAPRTVLELQLEEAFQKIVFCKTKKGMNDSIRALRSF